MNNGSYMPILHYALAVRMELLNEEWAQRNHNQSLSRLAERGGLSLCEAAAIIERRPWKKIGDLAAFEILRSMRAVKWGDISDQQAAALLKSLKK
jgi:hypothetical protein